MARATIRAATTLALTVMLTAGAFGTAGAFNPQPDPPGFGAFGITEFQRAHLHVALPAVQRGGRADPCRVDLHFVDAAGMSVASQATMIMPGQGATLMFTPTRTPPTDAAVAVVVAPVRHQLRAIIHTPAMGAAHRACRNLVATVQVDSPGGGAPTLTLSPFDLTRLDGNRATHHLFGPIVVGFGHTVRLNASYVGMPRGRRQGMCRIMWAFFDEMGTRVAFGDAMVWPGVSIFADFAHTDPDSGPAVIRAQAVAASDVNGACPSDAVIGTLEGFDSMTSMSHTIVPAQIVVPAVQ